MTWIQSSLDRQLCLHLHLKWHYLIMNYAHEYLLVILMYSVSTGACLPILLFTLSSQQKTVDCVWDGILHAAVMRTLCIQNLLLRARFIMTTAPGIKLCAITAYRLFHSHAQVLTFSDSTRWPGVYLEAGPRKFKRGISASHHFTITHRGSLFWTRQTISFCMCCFFRMNLYRTHICDPAPADVALCGKMNFELCACLITLKIN